MQTPASRSWGCRAGGGVGRRAGDRLKLQAAVEGVADAQRVHLGGGGKGAVVELVDGLAPEHQPTLEVLLGQAPWRSLVQAAGDPEGTAAVGLRAGPVGRPGGGGFGGG